MLLTVPRRRRHAATWTSSRATGQEAEGVRENVGKSLCWGYRGKEQARQGKQVEG